MSNIRALRLYTIPGFFVLVFLWALECYTAGVPIVLGIIGLEYAREPLGILFQCYIVIIIGSSLLTLTLLVELGTYAFGKLTAKRFLLLQIVRICVGLLQLGVLALVASIEDSEERDTKKEAQSGLFFLGYLHVAFVLALIYAVVVWAVEPRAPAPAVMDVDAEDGDETEPLVPQLVDI